VQPDSRLPGTLLRLVTLPDKKGRGNLAVLNLAATMDQRGQAHGAQAAVGKQPEISLLVPTAEGKGENFLSEPTIDQPELHFVADVLEVVIDDGDVTDALP